LRYALLRPGRVVVRLLFGRDDPQMLLAEDQHAVEEFAAQGADEAFAGRVHTRSLDGAAQNRGAVAWKTVSNEVVKFEPRSRIRNLMSSNGTVALRHPCARQGMITRMPRWSYGDCQVVEGDAEPVAVGDVGGDVVVVAAQVLHEGVTGGEGRR